MKRRILTANPTLTSIACGGSNIFSEQVFNHNHENKQAINLLKKYDERISTIDVSRQSIKFEEPRSLKSRFGKSRNQNIQLLI